MGPLAEVKLHQKTVLVCVQATVKPFTQLYGLVDKGVLPVGINVGLRSCSSCRCLNLLRLSYILWLLWLLRWLSSAKTLDHLQGVDQNDQLVNW